MLDIRQVKAVHLIGVGGVGLSAIATVLLERGYRVSGSDLRPSEHTRRLERMGARVYIGHAAEQVGKAEMVIVSSAIPPDNEELMAAQIRSIPVLKRDQVFSQLTSDHYCIAVAGTHGKTTTAAMIAWILLQADRDPSFIVGGTIVGLNTNARAGGDGCFVVEADEYDRAFLGLAPHLALVTHLEADHPDCFPDLQAMIGAFEAFMHRVRPEGTIIGCGDAPNLRLLLTQMRDSTARHRVLTYGLEDAWDWVARHPEVNGQGGLDLVAWRGQERLGRVQLQVPGVHNARNALAALAAVWEVGVSFDTACTALAAFRGIKRRFELKGMAQGVTVIDDYAHHPTQIRATLAAARWRYGSANVWALFQPHTYTRTRALLEGFADSFDDADHVLLLPIYPAREEDTLGISSHDVAAHTDHPDLRVVGGHEEAVEYLVGHMHAGDLLLTLGAGDGDRVGEGVLQQLRRGDE